eukprot:COSAG02_NODE_6529_length_3517_cov_89.205676_2_plen_83_part_00
MANGRERGSECRVRVCVYVRGGCAERAGQPEAVPARADREAVHCEAEVGDGVQGCAPAAPHAPLFTAHPANCLFSPPADRGA